MANNKKVGFLFLDEIHHIHHLLGPAVELSKKNNFIVDILTYDGEHEYLNHLIKLVEGESINLVKLDTFIYRKFIETLKRRRQPSSYYIYRKHIDKFLSYDMLVFTDHTARFVSSKRVNEKPYLVLLGHGAGDRAYGYKATHNEFDLVVVSGEKKYARLEAEFPDRGFNLEIAGYSKFDITREEIEKRDYFNNQNPVVLYNPHFDEQFSSWYENGIDILNYFKNHPEYNLIFAPHINLFNKQGVKVDTNQLDKFRETKNILMDLNSKSLVNMNYVINSDLYLGDVSSQIYEFIQTPRPAIFFNSHGVEWEKNENYLMWVAGKVVQDISELNRVINSLDSWKNEYSSIQKELFSTTFFRGDSSASENTAQILSNYIDNTR